MLITDLLEVLQVDFLLQSHGPALPSKAKQKVWETVHLTNNHLHTYSLPLKLMATVWVQWICIPLHEYNSVTKGIPQKSNLLKGESKPGTSISHPEN